jgi:hypothetical protein
MSNAGFSTVQIKSPTLHNLDERNSPESGRYFHFGFFEMIHYHATNANQGINTQMYACESSETHSLLSDKIQSQIRL